jgi:hypothetical protein
VEKINARTPADSLAALRTRIGLRLGEAESRNRRAPPIDIQARMRAIRSKVATA